MAHIVDGIYAATLTPLNSDFSCNVEVLVKHCNNVISRGCSGVVLFGTTGEGPSFSSEERESVIEQVIKHGLDTKKVMIGNGASGISETISLGKKAASLGYETMLISPPSFFKNVSDAGVISYYKTIIQQIPPTIKVILYHIPQFTGVPITKDVVQALVAEFPATVIGLKESEGNPAYAKLLLASFPGFKIFVGSESQIIDTVRSGGSGSICGIANVYPELICSLYHHAKNPQNPSNTVQLEKFLAAMRNLNFVAAFKTILAKREGQAWQTLHPPLMPLDQAQADQFLGALAQAQL